MNWSECKNFGLTDIDYRTNTVKLFYSPYSFQVAGTPSHIILEDANWQGNNLIVRGKDRYGERKTYIMNNFNSYQEIQF